MNNQEIYEKWQKLCDEHERAKEEFFSALATVDEKFRSIGKGESCDNPSSAETSAFHAAWEKWQDVQQRMDEFVKQYA